jgi:hypothetical protein
MAEDGAIQDFYVTRIWPAVGQRVHHGTYESNIVVVELAHHASEAAHG